MSEGQNNDRDLGGSGDLVGIKRATSNPYAVIGFAVISALGAGGSLALYPAENPEAEKLQRQLNAIDDRLGQIERQLAVAQVEREALKSREIPPPWFSRRVDDNETLARDNEKRIDRLERGN